MILQNQWISKESALLLLTAFLLGEEKEKSTEKGPHEYSYILSALDSSDSLYSYEIIRIHKIFSETDLVIDSIIVAPKVSRYKEQSRDPGRSYTLLPGLLLRPCSKCSFIKNNEGRLPTGKRAQ